MIIGVDPHKTSHTATAVDPLTNAAAASVRIDASLAGYRELLCWAGQFPERRWAIENAKGLGCHLAQWLIARDEHVVDVAFLPRLGRSVGQRRTPFRILLAGCRGSGRGDGRG